MAANSAAATNTKEIKASELGRAKNLAEVFQETPTSSPNNTIGNRKIERFKTHYFR